MDGEAEMAGVNKGRRRFAGGCFLGPFDVGLFQEEILVVLLDEVLIDLLFLSNSSVLHK